MSDNVMRMRYYVRQRREEINRLRRALVRKKASAAQQQEPPPPLGHGNANRYRNGCRCDPCRVAHREATAQRRLERLISGELNHGNANRYRNGCRCVPCLDARRAVYRRERGGA